VLGAPTVGVSAPTTLPVTHAATIAATGPALRSTAAPMTANANADSATSRVRLPGTFVDALRDTKALAVIDAVIANGAAGADELLLLQTDKQLVQLVTGLVS
jgi:hypothetical protein